MMFATKHVAAVTLLWALTSLSWAQQSESPTGTNPPAQNESAPSGGKQDASAQQANKNNKDKKDSIQELGEGKVTGTSNDRLFYALPNFLTLQGTQKVPPLSAKEKFKVIALGTFDYFEYPWWGALAAINQAENNEPGY